MIDFPTILNEPATVEKFQTGLSESGADFLAILSNVFTNTSGWLNEVQTLLKDSGDTLELRQLLKRHIGR